MSVPVDCLSCAHAIWSRLCVSCVAPLFAIALNGYLFKPRCALDFYRAYKLYFSIVLFLNFRRAPVCRVTRRPAVSGVCCLRRRAPRAPGAPARADGPRKKCVEKCVSSVSVARSRARGTRRESSWRGGMGAAVSGRASAPRRPPTGQDAGRISVTGLRRAYESGAPVGACARRADPGRAAARLGGG